MSGVFKKKDINQLKQSTRIDLHWLFFKRQLQIQYALLNKKLTICELGAGTGDIAQLSFAQKKEIIKKYICVEGSVLAKNIKKRNIPITLIQKNIEKTDLPFADIFLSKYVFHHIKNKEKTLNKIYQKLPKNGALVLIDRFPRFGKISVLIENIWNFLGIKKVLGKHYYSKKNNFLKEAKRAGFDVEYELIKKPKKLKNFFVFKGFYVLRK